MQSAAIQRDRTNTGGSVGGTDAQGGICLHHGSTTISHGHIILHRATRVVDHLISASDTTGHRKANLNAVPHACQRASNTDGALTCAQAEGGPIRRQVARVGASVTRQSSQISASAPERGLIDVLTETRGTDAQRAFPRCRGSDGRGGQGSWVAIVAQANGSNASNIGVHGDLIGIDIGSGRQADAPPWIQGDGPRAEWLRCDSCV